jgi:hypothetical protein
MKKIILFILLCPLVLSAQVSIERSVVNSAGHDYSDDNIEISGSVGEVVVGYSFLGEIQLNQGFQQADADSLTSVTEFETMEIKAFPNPTNGLITIDFKSNKELTGKKVSLELINIISESLEKKEITVSGSNSQVTFDLSSYCQGEYFLWIRSSAGSGFMKIVVNK